MICRIQGILESLLDTRALVRVEGGLTYEVLLPGHAVSRLSDKLGQPVTLQTIHYLEGSSQGANFTPRLAGFLTDVDKVFFELFVTVKGIGPRKALRCMSLSAERIAGAIADRDVKLLQSLPEIGKRMAETIVASLHGKVDRFISEFAYRASVDHAGASPAAESSDEAKVASGRRAVAREALEVLLQLGENRAQAVGWIDEILRRDPDVNASGELVSRVLEMKAGV